MYRKRVWLAVTVLMVLLTLACSVMPFGRTDAREDAAAESDAAEPAPQSRDDRLGETYESLEGGFAFQQVIGFDLVEFFGIVTMAPPDASQAGGPMITLIGGLNEEAKDAEQLMNDLQSGMPDTMELGRARKIKVDGIQGLVVDFSGINEGVEVEGMAVIIAVTDTQMFNLAAIYPAGEFGRDEESLVDALLDTVRFFEPQAGSETLWEEDMEEGQEIRQEVRQWASSAAASSEYSNPSWAAFQAAGPPDTAECADVDTAWASTDPYTYEWIELEYEQPVYPTGIHIHQTYNPNQVVQVELRDLSGTYHMVYLEGPQQQDCPFILTIPLEGVDFLVEGILVSLDQSVLDVGWNEIDAVELVGYVETSSPAGKGSGAAGTGSSGSGSAADISGWGWTNYTTANGLPDDNIQALVVADDGTVWIGMKEGGVSAFQDGVFTNYTTDDGLGSMNVKGLAIDQYDYVWAATANGTGFFAYGSFASYSSRDGLAHDIVNAVAVGVDERIWLATESGISVFDGNGFTSYLPADGQGRTNVKSVAAASNGDMWFATFNGVSRFDGQDWYYYNIEDGLSHDVYSAVGADPDGSVWLGSAGEAADRYDGSSFTSFKDEMGPTVYVSAITAGLDGAMWFGTEGDGLYRYDGSSWTQFLTSNSDLPYNWIDAVAVGPDGALWMATRKNGLTRFGP